MMSRLPRARSLRWLCGEQMKRYPRDEAVGYQVGDLRGAISARLRDTRP